MSDLFQKKYQIGVNYVFAIALNSYESSDLPVLEESISHVEELLEVLMHSYQVEPQNIIRLFDKDASEENIDNKFVEMQSLLTENDNLIVIFSGHSFFRSKLNESYMILYNGKKDSVSGCISSTSLMLYLLAIKARNILILADACISDEILTQFDDFVDDTGIITRHLIASGTTYLNQKSSLTRRFFFFQEVVDFLNNHNHQTLKISDMVVYLRRFQADDFLSNAFCYQYHGRDWEIPRITQEDIFWRRVVEENARSSYHEYLAKYPDGKYTGDAYQQLAEFAANRAWTKACETNRISDYEDFLLHHPSSKFVSDATRKIKMLKNKFGKITKGGGSATLNPADFRSFHDGVRTGREIDRKIRPEIKISKRGAAKDNSKIFPESFGLNESPSVDKEKANPYEAYPYISDPGTLDRDALFDVFVGLQQEKDETLFSQPSAIVIDRLGGEDIIEVVLCADGADVLSGQFKKMALTTDTFLKFRGKVLSQAEEVKLTAFYFYNNQIIGQATRVLPVQGFDKKKNEVLFAPGIIDFTDNIDPVDLHVWIKYSPGKRALNWIIQHENHSFDVNLDNNLTFALQLNRDLGQNNFRGKGALNTLKNIGEKIGNLIPIEFYNELNKIAKSKGAPPSLLIITNEYYIPWELAFNYHLEFDTKYLPFLNLQTEVGRWLISTGTSHAPSHKIEFDCFDVVAAEYAYSSDKLPEAIKEKEILVSRFGARPLQAKKNTLMGLSNNIPSRGRVLHMALHGYSNPELNEHSIQLEDDNLMAVEWLPPKRPGDKAVISFLFLNSCQVGASGAVFSLAGGFPGLLFPKGLLGLVAPLWDIHDDIARAFSENFYEQVLDGGQSVGKSILELRRKMEIEKSITVMAYLYYGHPGLQLEHYPSNDL